MSTMAPWTGITPRSFGGVPLRGLRGSERVKQTGRGSRGSSVAEARTDLAIAREHRGQRGIGLWRPLEGVIEEELPDRGAHGGRAAVVASARVAVDGEAALLGDV